ncbi:MAG TPA: rhomboid family intramembrane serine protease [Bdellovibrionales bacterium]|nr:rhomboid family intramembrane serine protease [Bdellovibrionales bacterium]
MGVRTDEDLSRYQIPQIHTVVRETWLSRRPSVLSRIAAALALLVLMLCCSLYWSNWRGAGDWMPATQALVFQSGEVWRLWTTLFAHSDLGHLLGNSFMFFILGYFLFGYFGFTVFPLWAFLMGGVTNALALQTYAPVVKLIGASGVVSWMGGVWLTLYFLLNTKKTAPQRALRAFGVALMLFAPVEAFDPNISYRTHAIGFVLGVLWGWAYFKIRRAEFRAAEVRQTLIE